MKLNNIKDKDQDNFIQLKVLPILKALSNIIILILIFALFVIIIQKLYELFFFNIPKTDFNTSIDNLLFILILIELFTVLYFYLLKNYIKIERVVELGIISVVRDLLFKINELDANKLYGFAAVLIAFGAIFFIEKYWSKTRNC